MIRPTATVHPIDFGVLSGGEFERLVFALLWRRWSWNQLDWCGQLGDDGGRDIWGYREDDWGRSELVVVACANWRRLTLNKAKSDIKKIQLGPHGLPAHIILAAGGRVSAELKEKVVGYALSLGIRRAEVWTGPEIEELLRHHSKSVLRRFLHGEVLPDEPSRLCSFIAASPTSEEEALRALGRLFDRPAFTTPFQSESSLPAFRRALTDTIEAINTGIYRTRDGTIIARLRLKNDFGDATVRGGLADIVRNLNNLRITLDGYLRGGAVRKCKCGDPDCPTFFCAPAAARALDRRRVTILSAVNRIVYDLGARPESPWRFL